MTSQELQNELSDTWYREHSADDAHDAIWGESFEGYTVPVALLAEAVAEIARLQKEIQQLRQELADTEADRDDYIDRLSC